MRSLFAIVGLALIGAQAWAQTAPTHPTFQSAIPTLPAQAARPNAPCRPTRFEPCSSANLPPGVSIATPANQAGELHSLTVDQAKNAIEAIGYSGVSELHRDAQGRWHGKAFRDEKLVSVTLDLNGSVVVDSGAATAK
jgi:hypothetical protein